MTDHPSREDLLTPDALLELARRIPKHRPTRILVGVPGLDADLIFKHESLDTTYLFIGTDVYRRILRDFPSATYRIPAGAHEHITGIQIEHYGARPDHENIFISIADAIARHRFIRATVDVIFGNTNPRLG